MMLANFESCDNKISSLQKQWSIYDSTESIALRTFSFKKQLFFLLFKHILQYLFELSDHSCSSIYMTCYRCYRDKKNNLRPIDFKH